MRVLNEIRDECVRALTKELGIRLVEVNRAAMGNNAAGKWKDLAEAALENKFVLLGSHQVAVGTSMDLDSVVASVGGVENGFICEHVPVNCKLYFMLQMLYRAGRSKAGPSGTVYEEIDPVLRDPAVPATRAHVRPTRSGTRTFTL